MERKPDETRNVEISIKGEAKAIAALVVALQERQLPEGGFAEAICSAIDHRTKSSLFFL